MVNDGVRPILAPKSPDNTFQDGGAIKQKTPYPDLRYEAVVIDIHFVLSLRLFHRNSINGFLGGNDDNITGMIKFKCFFMRQMKIGEPKAVVGLFRKKYKK